MSVSVERLNVAKPGPHGPQLILRDFSFRLAPEQRLAIVGPSGCGKTSLLLAVAGLDEASAGSVMVDGAPVADARDQGRISMAFQEPALLPWSGALDNVLLPVRLRRRATASDQDRARRLLEVLEIDPAAWSARPSALSGGMRQRVALASALVTEPSLLLLDEPFASVDEITRYRLLEALDAVLAPRRPTCLLVTHSVWEALLFADRILVLAGRPAEIVDDVIVDGPRPRKPHDLARPPLDGLSARVMRALGLA